MLDEDEDMEEEAPHFGKPPVSNPRRDDGKDGFMKGAATDGKKRQTAPVLDELDSAMSVPI